MKNFLILIPVYNPPESFINSIGKLIDSNEFSDDQILIIDDSSTNLTIKRLEKKFPMIKILIGDGNLWWGGGMRLGMKYAINASYDCVVWLNHDCMPDHGTVSGICNLASNDGVGAVSAWCYCKENRNFSVNPGFRNFSEIPIQELEANDLVEVDGVNGNCTAISVKAIKQVGLPEVERQPHYADGPYTWRLHQAGFKNYVATKFRAALEREFDRCIDEMDQSMFWHTSLANKFSYYLFSFRSKYHYKHRLNDLIVFRGYALGLLAYPYIFARLMCKIIRGHLSKGTPLETRLNKVIQKYDKRFPIDSLKRDLLALNNR